MCSISIAVGCPISSGRPIWSGVAALWTSSWGGWTWQSASCSQNRTCWRWRWKLTLRAAIQASVQMCLAKGQVPGAISLWNNMLLQVMWVNEREKASKRSFNQPTAQGMGDGLSESKARKRRTKNCFYRPFAALTTYHEILCCNAVAHVSYRMWCLRSGAQSPFSSYLAALRQLAQSSALL